MRDCVIRSRIDPAIKEKASKVFEHMGLTMSEAIRLFLYQSVAEKRIPFSVNIPNAKTIAAMQETDLEETSIAELKKTWKKACGK